MVACVPAAPIGVSTTWADAWTNAEFPGFAKIWTSGFSAPDEF